MGAGVDEWPAAACTHLPRVERKEVGDVAGAVVAPQRGVEGVDEEEQRARVDKLVGVRGGMHCFFWVIMRRESSTGQSRLDLVSSPRRDSRLGEGGGGVAPAEGGWDGSEAQIKNKKQGRGAVSAMNDECSFEHCMNTGRWSEKRGLNMCGHCRREERFFLDNLPWHHCRGLCEADQELMAWGLYRSNTLLLPERQVDWGPCLRWDGSAWVQRDGTRDRALSINEKVRDFYTRRANIKGCRLSTPQRFAFCVKCYGITGQG